MLSAPQPSKNHETQNMVKFIIPPTSQANLSDLARRANLIKIFVFLTFFSSFRVIAQREN